MQVSPDGDGAIMVRQGIAIMIAAFSLFKPHTAKIWSYAYLCLRFGALTDFEQALHFSASTYSTIGYGDVVLPFWWRILGAIEGAHGIMLLDGPYRSRWRSSQ